MLFGLFVLINILVLLFVPFKVYILTGIIFSLYMFISEYKESKKIYFESNISRGDILFVQIMFLVINSYIWVYSLLQYTFMKEKKNV